MNKRDLWLRLKAYHFENIVPPKLWLNIARAFGSTNASTKAFAAKIARKHQWKSKFALQAVEEYKKFVYLGLISNSNVTPSKTIDIVWHEHLLFSKAYREFCTNVIERNFDHQPELMAIADQTGQFSRQYLETIELYEKEFGIVPPVAIWGNTKFDKDISDKKNNTAFLATSTHSDPYFSEAPLYTQFSETNSHNFPEFNGYDGGDFGGAGASGDWSADSSSSDSSDSGSSCSSSCGGGD